MSKKSLGDIARDARFNVSGLQGQIPNMYERMAAAVEAAVRADERAKRGVMPANKAANVRAAHGIGTQGAQEGGK